MSRFWWRRFAVRKLFEAVKELCETARVEGIDVHYRNESFLHFVTTVLELLKERDRLNFQRVQCHLKAIVESPRGDAWAGRSIGVFFDDVSPYERERMGSSRYAALLTRFATEVKIIKSLRLFSVLGNRGSTYDRVVKCSVRRELNCCDNVGCSLSDVYALRRLLDEVK